MNAFTPRTFSTDWEIMVVDRLNRGVDMEKIAGFAGLLADELRLPIHVDWGALEIALGVNHSFAEFWERTERATTRAAELLAEYGLGLFPAGGHPLEPMFNAAHIHVGTIVDEAAAFHLENRLLRYVPAFAALAANTPVAQEQVGGYKSHRVRQQAYDCTRMGTVHDPLTAQAVWGTDACAKLYLAPTLEVRIIDSASSRRFLAELATFVAAFVQQLGHHAGPYTPSAQEYREATVNRWAAAKYGLQATFWWDGHPRPVVVILDEMLEQCAEGLYMLGASRSEFSLIELMLARRSCQADYLLGIIPRYPEPYLLADVYGKLVRHWEIIDDWLPTAPILEPVPAPDEEAILAEHLAMIGEGTHFHRTRDAMYLPGPVADQLIARLLAEGRIVREISEDRGILLSRV